MDSQPRAHHDRVVVGRKRIPVEILLLAFAACGPRVELPAEDLSCPDTRVDTRGCDFAVVPPLHLVPGISSDAGVRRSNWERDGVLVINDGASDARVQLVEAADSSRAVNDAETLGPGQTRMLRLPAGTDAPVSGELTALRLTTDAPVSAVLFAPYRSFVGNDSGLLIPANAWGTDYVVSAYAPHGVQFQGLGDPTFFDVVTLEPGVSVRWQPRLAATAAGGDVGRVEAGAWSPRVQLEPGVALRVIAERIEADPHAADVSGTRIEASGPVFVQSGSRCSAVPIETEPVSGCDPLFEPLAPISSWGTRYALPHPPLRSTEQHHFRLFAGRDAMEILVESDGALEVHALAETGDFVDLVVPHGANVVATAEAPFMPVGLLETRALPLQVGDPAMYTLPAPERFQTFQRVATGVEWSSHWLQVVRERSDEPLELDGEPVAGWTRFGDFEVVNVEVGEGTYDLASAQPFGVLQFGWTNEVHDACAPFASQGTCQTSYAHPAGFGVALE